MKPRIFISTVSSELGTVRQLTANVLQGLGYDPVWQDIFGTEPGNLKQVLREKIDDCQGLIQIVGRAYGAEPPEPDPEFGRVSYTQFEFLYARKVGRKTWVLIAEDGCTHDNPLEQLDLPRDPNHPEPTGYQAERRALQEGWRQRLRQEGHLRHGVTSDTELQLKLERLKSEFTDLRRGFRRWQRLVVAIGLTGLVLAAITFTVLWSMSQKTGDKLGKIEKQVEEVSKAQTITVERGLARSFRRSTEARAGGGRQGAPVRRSREAPQGGSKGPREAHEQDL